MQDLCTYVQSHTHTCLAHTHTHIHVLHTHTHTHLSQSPANALISDGVNENPNLTDNWDDAEGYYRKSVGNPFYVQYHPS